MFRAVRILRNSSSGTFLFLAFLIALFSVTCFRIESLADHRNYARRTYLANLDSLRPLGGHHLQILGPDLFERVSSFVALAEACIEDLSVLQHGDHLDLAVRAL